jgi:hypothetical protein
MTWRTHLPGLSVFWSTPLCLWDRWIIYNTFPDFI